MHSTLHLNQLTDLVLSMAIRKLGSSSDMFLNRKADILTCSSFPLPASTSLIGILISAVSPTMGDVHLSAISFTFADKSTTRNTVVDGSDHMIKLRITFDATSTHLCNW